MIQLNLDLNYLTKYFDITTQRLNEYSSKTIDEIMELEEESGNYSSSALLKAAMKSPVKLAKLLRLTEPENRYLIIKNLNDDDLEKLLPYLSSKDLLFGIQYFRVDKIIELLNQLPTEELLSVVLKNFTLKDIFMMMPNQEMNKLLENDEVERKDVMKYFEALRADELQDIMVYLFGAEMYEKNQKEQLDFMNTLEDREFTKMIQRMKPKDKALLLVSLMNEKPKLLEEVDHENYTRPMRLMDKPDIIRSMKDLDPEFLIPMVQELPPDLIQVVATQIDPQAFAQVLVDEFPDILEKIAL